jgi:outer membrane cobalamin receptor
MKKQLILSALVSFSLLGMAQTQDDTTRVVKLNEVVINSLKETSPQQTPVSSTIISSKLINTAQISNVRDLSGLVPNFFIPDYGSAMSTTSYIRGIGSIHGIVRR